VCVPRPAGYREGMTDPHEQLEPQDLEVEDEQARAVKGGRPRYQLKLDEAPTLLGTQPTPPPPSS
jgi:hypothetical protein